MTTGMTADEWDALPLMLTVEEAGRLLRIGRSHAYALTTRYFASGGADGLPALRLGGVLRVPKAHLHDLISTGRVAQLAPTSSIPTVASVRKPTGGRQNSSQLPL